MGPAPSILPRGARASIGTRLFISSHPVQYHLGKVFTKLGITSRGLLNRALPSSPDTPGH